MRTINVDSRWAAVIILRSPTVPVVEGNGWSARSTAASLLAMGGQAHDRLRELILDGATAQMIRAGLREVLLAQ